MKAVADTYKNRRVLITGHTGFKGSWLALWLHMLGAKVHGLALPQNTSPSHWGLLRLEIPQVMLDIRNAAELRGYIASVQPDIVFHLAAQPLVLRSYEEPLETWQTNVIGTANVLDAIRHVPSIRAAVVVSSDKCYENLESGCGFKEEDRLGGHDPYSASKAAVEMVTSSYRCSFFEKQGNALVASARAGNVIGGGDWTNNRLLPDIVKAVETGAVLKIRCPNATRPWQHVLDCLSGYLKLGQKLLEGQTEFASAWNFGPQTGSNQTVVTILQETQKIWPKFKWEITSEKTPHEAGLLWLNSSKARSHLGWTSVLDWKAAIAMTVDWYKAFNTSHEPLSRYQIEQYQNELSDR